MWDMGRCVVAGWVVLETVTESGPLTTVARDWEGAWTAKACAHVRTR